MEFYYQGVVVEYLRADRSVFVNTECCIQLNEADNPDGSGPHWYCDAVAVNFRDKAIFLCEVSYASDLGALLKRLQSWNSHWLQIKSSLLRDCNLPDWRVRPWLFIPDKCVVDAVKTIQSIGASPGETRLFQDDPRITTLELVTPWNYCTWDRKGEPKKPDTIPPCMQV